MLKSLAILLPCCIALATSRCTSETRISLNEADSGRTVAVGVGDAIEVTLGTVGPGQYGDPQVSAPAIRFVQMTFVGATPGGPTQLFRFEAATRGQASVVITQEGTSGPSRTFSLQVDVGN
jgi:hypothetical protein